jgi:hypothetical protein
VTVIGVDRSGVVRVRRLVVDLVGRPPALHGRFRAPLELNRVDDFTRRVPAGRRRRRPWRQDKIETTQEQRRAGDRASS